VGNLLLVFHFSIRLRGRSCGNVEISPAVGEISKGSWKEWEAGLWLSMLSTAPAFPQLSRLPVFAVATGKAARL
jgi:hypothetical protein